MGTIMVGKGGQGHSYQCREDEFFCGRDGMDGVTEGTGSFI